MSSRDKVVVLRIIQSDWLDIREHMIEFERSSFGINFRSSPSTQTMRVGLIVADSKLVALALVRSAGRSGTLDTLVSGSSTVELTTPVPVAEIIRRIGSRRRARAVEVFANSGVLTDQAAADVLAGLGELSEEASDAFGVLRAKQPRVRARTSPISQLIHEQRDAIALGLEIAGIDSKDVLPAEPADPAPLPFLTTIAALAPATEAASIRHDARTFDDWELTDGQIHDSVRFTDPRDPRRAVTVLYADKEELERVTGTDLIYYRQHRPGFVLVQYKRMTHDATKGTGEQWGYRPDAQLDEEISRMNLFSRKGIATDTDGWRLSAEPFYMKLIESNRLRPETSKLVKGMYFPLDLFELLLASPAILGPREGRRIGWHNGSPYLTNTDFISLLRAGFVGSTGSSTAELGNAIDEVIRNGRGAVIVRDEAPADLDRRRRAR